MECRSIKKGENHLLSLLWPQKDDILDLNTYKSHVSNTYTEAESHHTKSLATKGIFCGREL